MWVSFGVGGILANGHDAVRRRSKQAEVNERLSDADKRSNGYHPIEV